MKDSVNIYDTTGMLIDSIPVGTNLTLLGENRRVSRGDNGLYYKGAGIKYQYHHVLSPLDDSLQIIARNTDIVYGGYVVKDLRYEGLEGIICTPYQSYFRDYIGGCGPKEEKIVENSKAFEFSGVAVRDCIPILDSHNIYICSYKARDGLESTPPSPKKLAYFLDYVLYTEWCCPWDKNTYRDIDGLGLLRDPADWFLSESFNDKLGSVYSILYPLYLKDRKNYQSLLHIYGIDDVPISLFTIPHVCLLLLYMRGNEIPDNLRGTYDMQLYKDIMVDHIFRARYCCQMDPSHDKYYDNIRDLMVLKFYKDVGRM